MGIITDGDLRRTFQSNKKFEEMSARDIMTRNPITIAESLNVKESLEIMNEKNYAFDCNKRFKLFGIASHA